MRGLILLCRIYRGFAGATLLLQFEEGVNVPSPLS